MYRMLTPLALCLSLAACNMYTAPGSSASAYDGSYQGSVSQIHYAPNSCSSTETKPATLAVQSGSVVWTASPALTLYAPVAPDGGFNAQNGTTFFSGKITKGALVARSNNGACYSIYDLSKTT